MENQGNIPPTSPNINNTPNNSPVNASTNNTTPNAGYNAPNWRASNVPSNYDPNNPPEFNPNENQPTLTQKHAVSGLGIAIIVISIVMLGLLVGHAIGLFLQADSSKTAQTTGTYNCTTIDCCHNYGRCMAVSSSSPYACKDIKTCVTCNVSKCSYEDVDTTYCKGKPCGPTTIPTGTPPVTYTPKAGGVCAAVPGKTKVCLGNNYSNVCVDRVIDGKNYACYELVGDYGYAVIDPATGNPATDPNKKPNCSCEEPYSWLNYEYGRWWCFDTHAPGVCTPDNDTRWQCKPGSCKENPKPTGTIVDTPTPTETPTPTDTITPTPTDIACEQLQTTEHTTNNYDLTCNVSGTADQCKFTIDNSDVITAQVNNGACTVNYEFSDGQHDVRCYAVNSNDQTEVSNDNCTAQVNINVTPTPTIPNTGVFDSPIALASLSLLVISIALYEFTTGGISTSLLKFKHINSQIKNSKEFKFTIKLSRNSKIRKLLEQRLTEET